MNTSLVQAQTHTCFKQSTSTDLDEKFEAVIKNYQ